MDGPTVGLVIAVLAGLSGTCVAIRNAKRPRERAFAVRAAAWCWAFLAGHFLIPMPWRPLLWAVFVPATVLLVRRVNERQALPGLEDRGQVEAK